MQITTTVVDSLNDEQRAFVDAGFAAGKAEGAFPAHRSPPGDGDTYVFAAVDGEYAGFASFFLPEHIPVVWLDLLYVDPVHRRRSIGTILAAGVMAVAQREGLPFECGTLVSNQAMQSLAASLGLEGNSILYRKEPVIAQGAAA
jgi:GNAT superfamily N-acetyltransferase